MNLNYIYTVFPTQKDCIDYLEHIRWNGNPVCPYCKSTIQSPLPNENRYHCNTCNTSFSVKVGTFFENTKLDIQIWFLAISLILNSSKGISARKLAISIGVTKDTAWHMQLRLKKAINDYGDLLHRIVESDILNNNHKNSNG